MADFLATASAWLGGIHRTQVSQTVVIHSGAAESDPIPATIGSTEFQQDNGEGILTTWQSRDYLIAVSDYALEGNIVEPEEGHQITEGTLTYEVVSPGGEPCARYSDAQRLVWRIHTKFISE